MGAMAPKQMLGGLHLARASRAAASSVASAAVSLVLTVLDPSAAAPAAAAVVAAAASLVTQVDGASKLRRSPLDKVSTVA